MDPAEFASEQAALALVQETLFLLIHQARDGQSFYNASITEILTDAWEQLRERPTALSPQELDALQIEIDRYLSRRDFTIERERRFHKVMNAPYFARIDFVKQEAATALAVRIGPYSIMSSCTSLLVYDWRAPISSLYYEAQLGPAGYHSVSGEIRGELTLKRQYQFENGRLSYYVDTDINIDDSMLLSLLARASSRTMQQIVATIQREQNAAIRYDNVPLLAICGGAGSGKTAVALHRAAYLMYRNRDALDATHMCMLSPSDTFSQYISQVLPELGERSIATHTPAALLSSLLGMPVQPPFAAAEDMLTRVEKTRQLRMIALSQRELPRALYTFADKLIRNGPAFTDLKLGARVIASRGELAQMFRTEYAGLNYAQKLARIQLTLEAQIEPLRRELGAHYRKQLEDAYDGRALEYAVRLIVSQALKPLLSSIRAQFKPTLWDLYAQAMPALKREAKPPAQLRWEDAAPLAYIGLLLGFLKPDRNVRHLIVDETQDYSPILLRTLALLYPDAHVTLLGDPRQCTMPGLPTRDADAWCQDMGYAGAPTQTLSRCYRSTLQITRFANALLPDEAPVAPLGREGKAPALRPYSIQALRKAIQQCARDNVKSIAVIARTLPAARALSALLPGSRLLDDDQINLPERDVVVAPLSLIKGMEFDAVFVIWPNTALTPDELRRLYAAVTRALHVLQVFVAPTMLAQLEPLVSIPESGQAAATPNECEEMQA